MANDDVFVIEFAKLWKTGNTIQSSIDISQLCPKVGKAFYTLSMSAA